MCKHASQIPESARQKKIPVAFLLGHTLYGYRYVCIVFHRYDITPRYPSLDWPQQLRIADHTGSLLVRV